MIAAAANWLICISRHGVITCHPTPAAAILYIPPVILMLVILMWVLIFGGQRR